MSSSEVTAVVVNYNGGENVQHCLHALAQSEVPLFEVIVVDNGSSDGSPEQIEARFPEVRIIALGENRGLSAARNIGLKAARTEFLLLLDDDVYIRRDTISRMLQSAHQNARAIIGPRFLLYPQREIVQAQGASVHLVCLMQLHHGYKPASSAPDVPQIVGAAIGGCYLGRTDHFIRAGGFDELFFAYLEDLEFSLRLRGLGYDFFAAPAAVVDHDRGSAGLSFRGQGAYPRSRAYFAMRHRRLAIFIHYQLRSIVLLSPSLWVYEILNLIFIARNGWWRDWFRAWRWLWQERTAIISRRQAVHLRRVRRDSELLQDGDLTFAPGLIQSPVLQGVVQLMTSFFSLNWRLVRRFV